MQNMAMNIIKSIHDVMWSNIEEVRNIEIVSELTLRTSRSATNTAAP